MLSAALVAASAAVIVFVDTPRQIWPGTGVNIQFTTPRKGEMELLAKGGFKYTRSVLPWAETETAPGKYDFSKFEGLLRDLKTKGIRQIFCLSGSNPAYQAGAPTMPEARAAFARWAGQAALQFKGEEIVWEVWNEPNAEQSWKPIPSPTDYSSLAVETAKAMRFMDPTCRIIAPAGAGVDTQFLNSSLTEELLSLVDGISIHPNRIGGPESLVGELQAIRDLIARRAPAGRKELPIICTGWGYSTARGKNTEGRQAMYVTRMWLLNSALNIPITVYDSWQDNGPNPDNPADRLGLVRENLDLKPSFIAVKEVIEKFRGCTNFRWLPQKDPLDWVIVGAGSSKLVQARWYQKEAGVKFSDLSMKEKRFKTLYASLTGGQTVAIPRPVATVTIPNKPIARSLDGLDFAFAPPIDEDGWCVLVQKSTTETAKLEFKYQRSNGANVTCYAKIDGPRIVEPIATTEESPMVSVGVSGSVSESYKLQKTSFDPTRWEVKREGKLTGELLAGQRGVLLNYDGGGKALVVPKSRSAIPEGARALVVWVRPDGSSNRLKSEYRDSAGEVISVDLGSMEGPTDRNGWRVLKIPLGGKGVEWVSLLAVESERERSGSIEIGPGAYMF
ncbi:MAG: hypothetical protein WCK51_10625 [Armatimonadota bacterium]